MKTFKQLYNEILDENSKSWKELGIKTKDRFDYAYTSGKLEGLQLGYDKAKEEMSKRTRLGKKLKEVGK